MKHPRREARRSEVTFMPPVAGMRVVILSAALCRKTLWDRVEIVIDVAEGVAKLSNSKGGYALRPHSKAVLGARSAIIQDEHVPAGVYLARVRGRSIHVNLRFPAPKPVPSDPGGGCIILDETSSFTGRLAGKPAFQNIPTRTEFGGQLAKSMLDVQKQTLQDLLQGPHFRFFL